MRIRYGLLQHIRGDFTSLSEAPKNHTNVSPVHVIWNFADQLGEANGFVLCEILQFISQFMRSPFKEA